MNRKDFIHSCGVTCLGALSFGLMLQGCAPAKIITVPISGSDLLIPLSAFIGEDGNPTLTYLIVENENLQYPICVYQLDATTYSALYMQCTHQGAELRAFGDRLQCPAHGSEFTNKGEVQSGPADQPLRTFPVIIEKEHLRLSLK